MYISNEAIAVIIVHVALLLACAVYAGFLSQEHIYKAYHPHHTIWTVVGGEILVGIAFGLACAFARKWLQAEPLVACIFFATLQGAAAIPIWRWQRQQAATEKAREKAFEERIAKEMAHGD